MLRAVYVATILAFLAPTLGCAGSIETFTMTPEDERPDFLVEVTSTPPTRPTRTVSLSVVAADPTGVMAELPEPKQVATMRSVAARYGANFLLIERFDTRWRRVYYGRGLQLQPVAENPPRGCATEVSAAALNKIAKKAEACIVSLRKQRPSLRASIEATLHIDPFGRLKAIKHAANSSRDTMVRNCVARPAARASFGAHRAYVCTAPLSIVVE